MEHVQPIEISEGKSKDSLGSKISSGLQKIGIVMPKDFIEAAKSTPANYPRAFRIYKKLAMMGDSEAQHNIAVMYDQGLGTSKSSWKAARWFRNAAEQGVAEAQYNLGVMYELGQGVFSNNIKAYHWYFLAKDNGIRGANKALSNLSKRMTEKELERAKKMAIAR